MILNSWQQNKASSQIVINISIHKVGGLLKIAYEDSGVGLPPKYINDPMRILEVHESSREMVTVSVCGLCIIQFAWPEGM